MSNTSENADKAMHPHEMDAEVRELIKRMQYADGSVLKEKLGIERPMHGTTLYLASCRLDTVYGEFCAHVFQDVVDKHYVMALTHGDISGTDPMYVRMHSSCLTSETLGGCDCDCVQQLNGAFRMISEKGRGVLFYLMQEGRAAGLVGKSRDRMLVQASHDKVSTYQAYEAFGLKHDHRNYQNIGHICHLLGLKASFIVLTNNPDKISSIKEQGFTIAGTERLEFAPSPFNVAYLSSKAHGGHDLLKPSESSIPRAYPPKQVSTFKPYVLSEAKRFIHMASYFLPMKPVAGEVVLDEKTFGEIFDGRKVEDFMGSNNTVIESHETISEKRHLLRINTKQLTEFIKKTPDASLERLLTMPNWFEMHVYYDIVKGQEMVVLTYGELSAEKVPVTRIHRESLFNRFPLKKTESRDRFQMTVREIIRNGSGALLLLQDEGTGAGFGAYAVDRMMTEQGEASSEEEGYEKLGVASDGREHMASILLLKHHLKSNRVAMAMYSPESLVKNADYVEALGKLGVEVERWVFLKKD